MDMLAQRSKLASTAIPVKDAAGNILGYTTGTGASLPNPNRNTRNITRQAQIEGQWFNFYDDGTAELMAVPANATSTAPIIAWDGTKTVELPPGTDINALPPGLSLLPQTNATPAPAAPGTASAPAAPSATKSFMDRFKK
jgi:nucleoid-associated protein YgaU